MQICSLIWLFYYNPPFLIFKYLENQKIGKNIIGYENWLAMGLIQKLKNTSHGFLHLSHLHRPDWHIALLEHQPLYFLFLHLFRTSGTFLFLQYWCEGQWWSSSHSTHRNPSHLPVERIQIINKMKIIEFPLH